MKLSNRSFVAAASLAVACAGPPQAGTKTGNGITLELGTLQQNLSASPDAGAEESGVVAMDASGSTFVIEQATLGITEIELRAAEQLSCDDVHVAAEVDCEPDRLRIRGDIEVELVSGTSLPSLEDVRLPSGTYQRVEIRLDVLDASTTLGAASFLASGWFLDGERRMPFRLELEQPETLRFEDANPLRLGDGGRLLALLDVAGWLAALPIVDCWRMGALPVEDDVVLVRDTETCMTLEDRFVDALRASTRLDDD